MGSAILGGLLGARVVGAARLAGYDPAPGRVAALRRLHVRSATSSAALARASNVVVLAVKPQVMRAVLHEIAPALTPRHLVISIAAGISTRRIEHELGRGIPVVRVMPNTPAQICQGMSVMCRGRAARAGHVAAAAAIFSALGEVLVLPERFFHAVTAVSGSGPAYVFFFMEGMVEAGRRLRVPPRALRRLVLTTVLGSARLAHATGEALAALRARVTSKGGTTEAAFRVFDRAKVRQGIVAGIVAAARRSSRLARSVDRCS